MNNSQNDKPNKTDLFVDSVRLIDATQDWLQNITGTKITINKRKAQKSIEPKIDSLRSLFQELNLTDLWKLDENERKKRFVNFMTRYFRIVFDLPQEQNPLELMVSSVSNFFEADKKYIFLKNTRYSEYKKLLFIIIRKLYSDTKMLRSVKILSRSVPAEEFFEISQLALSLSSAADFLQKDHKRLTEAVVRKYISAYRDMGAYMEKITRFLVAIQEILRGKSANMTEIRKHRTSNHVKKLKADSTFRGLLSPFNVVVWNATKHPGWFIKPEEEKVKFTDNQETVAWDYQTLKRQTCELYATMHVLSHFKDALNLYTVQRLVNNSLIFPSEL